MEGNRENVARKRTGKMLPGRESEPGDAEIGKINYIYIQQNNII
jgi:hypothetical protein